MSSSKLLSSRSGRGVAAIGVLALAAGFWGVLADAQQGPRQVAGFNLAQEMAGKASYDERCASCHGADLSGAGPSVALTGSTFLRKWSDKPASDLFAQIRRMPPGNPQPLDATMSANIMAYILKANGVSSGNSALPTSETALAALALPAPGAVAAATPAARGRQPVVIAPSGPSRLDRLTPVTDAQLKSPPAADWLHWRRTYDAQGFSPLKQIDRSNAGKLKLAWAWSLPRGDNMMTPIVHDGVMFALSSGDIVEALDAASGELLWRFERTLSPGASFHSKKGLAIAGDVVLVPTSDMHVIALEAKTGRVKWDHAIGTRGEVGFQIKSSPLVAGDKVVIGVNGFTTRGGNFIAAFDLATGREAWRFYTLAKLGEPGGETWNGQAPDALTGGSVWVAGSYDPALNLVYYGSAPTYNTEPLRTVKPGFSTDALYTNATVALNASTGKLVWYFQHQKNDQLDHDWAFERQIIDLPVNGKTQHMVLTGGKQAIFEAMDATTGAYRFSVDLDMQNVITAIDPKTGDKTINPKAIPTPGQTLTRQTMPGICPDLLGARNLMSTAYDADTATLFVPMTDTCVQPWPNGERWQKHPDPSSAGKFGLIKAISLKTQKVTWAVRERAGLVSGALATAGGLLFLGDVDRWFSAYDVRNGKKLWTTRLDNAVESYPVTYSVDGRQYVAVATNEGFVHARAMRQALGLTPPPSQGATLWVFALPN